MTEIEKLERIEELIDEAEISGRQHNAESIISYLEEALSLFSEIPFRKVIGKYSLSQVYRLYAVAIGVSGESLRNSGNITDALEKDFRGIFYMERAIEHSDNIIQIFEYRKEIIIPCIYVASDLFKMKYFIESFEYCEKIIKYSLNLPFDADLAKNINSLASNYGKRNKIWIEKNFGKETYKLSRKMEKKLNRCAKKDNIVLRLFNYLSQ